MNDVLHKALHGGLAAAGAATEARISHIKGAERKKRILGAAGGAIVSEIVSESMMSSAMRRMETQLLASGHAPNSKAYTDLRQSLLKDEFLKIKTVAQLAVVATAESLKFDLNSAMFAANNALENNSAQVFFKLMAFGSLRAEDDGCESPEDNSGYDTDEEADQQEYGKNRKKVLDAATPEALKKYGKAAAEYNHHLSLGPIGYAEAMLEKNTGGHQLSPVVRQTLLDSYEEHYFDMLFAYNMLQGVGQFAELPGKAGEFALRKAGLSRATARNVHRAIDDGLTIVGIGSLAKLTGKFGGRTAGKTATNAATRTSLDGLGLETGKKEQPWTIREGQEWKGKVIGRAQKTGTDGHSFRSYREAIKSAKQDDVDKVLLNRGVNRVLDQKIRPNRRPDVTVVRKNGRIDQVEVPSKTDKPKDLRARMDDTSNHFPLNRAGKNEIKNIRGKK